MSIVRQNVISLYREFLKYSKTLKYTDKDFFLNRIRKEFYDNRNLTSAEEIELHLKRGKNFLSNKRLL
ncbi:hypothetical protein JTE90_018304 [Oedothorax gibbosus]|uniref:Complex 1 LYR protein domain-containing protein n=1 Tax=Oedothorax gibbosus TaxID=931172 RepID=A0AAV6UGK8_9ARAC|nr:hypothetical protein JTE90_018304 [Oedothorax gibbosus]